MPDYRQELTAVFPQEAIEWRIVKLSDDETRARVRPQLYYQAVIDRLNQIGELNWSNRFLPIAEDALAAEIRIDETVKSRVVSLNSKLLDSTIIAQDAFVLTAEDFGIKTNIEPGEYWVDYDAVSKSILFVPEVEIKGPQNTGQGNTRQQNKPQTKEVIDRLVERLRAEGLGLEAAKLLTKHGGYGEDGESAKLLYGKLRSLLLKKTAIKEK